MFDLFFIFSGLFLVRFITELRTQKIAADKANIMECDPESASVTSKFFPKSNSVHYYALTMEL